MKKIIFPFFLIFISVCIFAGGNSEEDEDWTELDHFYPTESDNYIRVYTKHGGSNRDDSKWYEYYYIKFTNEGTYINKGFVDAISMGVVVGEIDSIALDYYSRAYIVDFYTKDLDNLQLYVHREVDGSSPYIKKYNHTGLGEYNSSTGFTELPNIGSFRVDDVRFKGRINLDTQAPTVAFSYSTGVSSSQINGSQWIRSNQLTVSSNSVNDGDGAGVTENYWRSNHDQSITAYEGINSFNYYVKDKVGNEKDYNFTLKLDTTLPTFDINISDKREWINNLYSTVTATNVTDNLSSVYDKHWIGKDGSRVDSDTLNLNTEGIYTIKYHVKDGAGNGGYLYSNTVKVDVTPPSKPSPGFIMFNQSGETISANMSWAGVTDNLSSVTYKTTHGTPSGTTGSFNVNLGSEYNYTVTATDQATNSSVSNPIKIKVPKQLSIQSIDSETNVTGEHKPQYKNTLKFIKNDLDWNNSCSTIPGYTLKRDIIYPNETVETSEYSININNGTYSESLTGKKYKHATVKYYLITQFNNISLEPQIREINLSNILPDTTAELVVNSIKYTNEYWSNTVPKIKLSQNYSLLGLDVEDDAVTYFLHYGTGFKQLTVNTTVKTDTISIPQNDFFDITKSGIYKFSIYSSDSGIDSGQVNNSQEFSYKFDDQKPEIVNFQVKGLTRGSNKGVLSKLQPTNSETVSINAVLYDMGASGLKSLKVSIFNMEDESNPVLITELGKEYGIDFIKTNSISYTEDEVTKYDITIPDLKLPDVLTGTSKTFKVRLELFDNAKNVNTKLNVDNGQNIYMENYVVIDKISPVLTDNKILSTPYQDNQVEFLWSWSQDETNLLVETTTPGEFLNQYTRMILDPNGYNKSRTLNLKITDEAGNETSYVKEGYSRASFGVLNEPLMGYTVDPNNPDLINRWMDYILTYNSDEAKDGTRYLIRIDSNYNEDTSFSRIPLTNKEANSGTYRIENLSGHNEAFNFKILALNNLSQPFYSEPLKTPKYKNFEPVFSNGDITSAIYQQTYGTLGWKKAIDGNSDPTIYTVKIFNKTGTKINEYSGSENYYSLSELGLEINESYTWILSADEELAEYEGNGPVLNSETIYIDGTNPIISNLNIPDTGHFTNIKQLTFNSSDIETPEIKNSGIAEAIVSISVNGETYIKKTKQLNGNNVISIWDIPEGNLTVNINITDKVGLTTPMEDVSILVDRTSPIITAPNLLQKQNSDKEYIYTDNDTLKISLLAKDNYSGISHLSYAYTDKIGDVITAESWTSKNIRPLIPFTGDNSEQDIETDIDYLEPNGSVKYLVLRIYDYAGNYDEVVSSKPVLKDVTVPIVSEENMDIFTVNNYKNYLADYTELSHLDIVYTDNESGMLGVKYILVNGDAELLLKDFEDKNITPINLVDGESYKLQTIGKNRGSLVKITTHTTFTYDSSSPTNLKLNQNNSVGFVEGQVVDFDISVIDNNSPIVSAELSIGTDSNMSLISKNITGNNSGILELLGGWIIDNNGLQSNKYIFNLPEKLDNGTYKARLKVTNASGKEGVIEQNIFVDNEQNIVFVEIPGTYTSTSNEVRAKWNYHNPLDDATIESIRFRVNNLTDWVTISTNIIDLYLTTDPLLENVTYSVEVELILSNGLIKTGLSKAFYLDKTGVNRSNEKDMEVWPKFSESESLYSNWDLYDDISGVKNILFRVEKYSNGDFVNILGAEWVKVDGIKNKDSYTFNNLGLITGDRVIITRKIINGAGISVEDQSPIIIIDNTAPENPIVVTGSTYLNPVLIMNGEETATPVAHWIFSPGDSESNTDYFWTYINNIKDISSNEEIDWTEGDESKRATVTNDNFTFNASLHGETWYFVVKAVNSLGLTSYGYSSGIIFDTTAPKVTKVKLLESVPGKESVEVFYIKTLENLQLYIEATDDVSGNHLNYSGDYGIFTNNKFISKSSTGDVSNGSDSILSISKLNPINEVVFFKGIVSNGVDLQGDGYSFGTKVDTVKPIVKNITGNIYGYEDDIDSGGVIKNNAILKYTWEIEEGNSPIINYEYRIKKNSNFLGAWRSLNSKIPILELDTGDDSLLTDGHYIVSIRAISDSGLVGDSADSSVLVVDNSSPEILKVKANHYASDNLNVVVTATDGENGSGIKEYQYRLGTFCNPQLLSNGWITVEDSSSDLARKIELDGFGSRYSGVMDGEELYLSFMVKDRAGNWSGYKNSNVITIDKTPAIVKQLEVPGFSRYKSTLKDIYYNVEDIHSGVEYVDFNIYEILNGSEKLIKSKTITVSGNTVEETIEVNFGEDIFEHNKHYIIKTIAYNGTGDPSIEVSSIYKETLDISELTSGSGYISPVNLTVDLVPPKLVFNKYNSEIIVNESSEDNKYDINYSLSEIGNVTISLIKNNKDTKVTKIPYHFSGDYKYGYHHYRESEVAAYGDYKIVTTVFDRAGNESEYHTNLGKYERIEEQHIRYNRPPTISITNMLTNPGRDFELKADFVIDHDGDYSETEPLLYEWRLTGNGKEEDIVLYGESPSYKFFQEELRSPRSAYGLSLKVTDSNGKSTIMNFEGNSDDPLSSDILMIIVRNTWEGPLFVNEYWSILNGEDSHIIGGDITVGEGLKLTIEPDTIVEIGGNSTVGYNHELIINGILDFVPGSITKSIFRMNDYANTNWKGITVNNSGTGNILNAKILDARDAISIFGNGNVLIDDCLIINNIIGIHVFSSKPVITNTVIENQKAYGIKEDGVVNISLSGNGDKNSFRNNTIDYYETGIDGTDAILIDIEGIN